MRRRQGAQHHCFPVRPGQWPQSVGKAGTPCQAATHRLAAHRAGRLVVASVAHARYGHPLRFYIRPHFAKWSPAATLKLRLVSATADAPSRVYKTGLMQSGLRWRRSPSRRRTPVSSCPTRRRPVALMAVEAPWHWSVASQVFQSVAWGQSSPVSPRPPHRGLAAARHWPPCAGLPVCPPRGRPQSGEKTRRLTAATINCIFR